MLRPAPSRRVAPLPSGGALALAAVVGTVAMIGGLGACATKNIGGGAVVLPVRPSVYMRVTPDADASELVGSFVPDNVDDADIDESQAIRTRCSRFITPRRIPASGDFREVTAASTNAAGRFGVKSIARVAVGGTESQALLVSYSLHEKMQATVDEDGLAQCCAAAPDQCTKRYISGAVMADGQYFAATERGSDNGVDGATALRKLNVDASVLYEHDMKWERQGDFKRQYFAFMLQRTLSTSTPGGAAGGTAGGAAGAGMDGTTAADSCAWANNIPTSLDGNYFVGVSNPMPTERLAREDAMRDAREQVVRFLGEFLTEASASAQRTTGKAEDLSVLLEDVKTKASLAQGVARYVKDQRWCGPTEQATPSGMKTSMKVLAFFPNTEKKSAALAALRGIIEARRTEGGATASLEAMLRELESRP
jgi:hypothetical protein